MNNKSVYRLHAATCKALAHPLRLEVIEILQKKELCFSEILEKTGGLKSNLSQHLTIMVNGGILRMRKNSRCNYYSLSSRKVADACRLMRGVLLDNINKQKQILERI